MRKIARKKNSRIIQILYSIMQINVSRIKVSVPFCFPDFTSLASDFYDSSETKVCRGATFPIAPLTQVRIAESSQKFYVFIQCNKLLYLRCLHTAALLFCAASNARNYGQLYQL